MTSKVSIHYWVAHCALAAACSLLTVGCTGLGFDVGTAAKLSSTGKSAIVSSPDHQ